MAKYVTTDGSGRPTGFYDSVQNPAIPEGAQALTNAQYTALLTAPATTTFVGGALGSVEAIVVPPTPVQQALAALAAGLAITSTASAGALNGTYALDTTALGLAADLVALIAANSGAFPGSAATWSWPDKAGALHVFPSASDFVAFHQALTTYRLGLYAVIWGVTTDLPADAATIP